MNSDGMITLFLVVLGSVGTLGYLYAKARGRIQELERILGLHGPAAHLPAHVEETTGEVRLAQLEQQVDLMTNQLDRVIESQDFLSRVLTERVDRLPPPRDTTPRVDTPH